MFFLCFFLAVQPAFSAPPAWWTTQNVLDTTKTANDYAAVNQGQLKAVAKKAITEMNANLPGGAGTELNDLLTTWSAVNATRNDYTAVNVGQVKALAKKFYDRLNAVGVITPYPWTTATTDDKDYAAANIGQVKAAFSFAIPLSVISPPASLTATAGSAKVTLTWSAVTAATSYKLQRATVAGGPYADFTGNTVNAPTVTLINTGLTNNTTYYYVAYAVNASGTSLKSNEASAKPVAKPAAPTGVTATAGNAQVTLSWSASTNATSYKVQRSTTTGTGYADFTGNTVNSPTLTLTNTGLTNGTTYYYVVTATNGSGTSANSAQVSATPIAIPVAPTGLTATAGAAQVVLNWTAVSGATSYKIQRSTTSGSGYADFAGNTVSAPTVTFTNTGLTNGTTYYYIIFAVNGIGTSPASTQVSATPQPVPTAPTGFTATPGSAQAVLNWTAVSGATSYKIQRSTTSGSGYADFAGNTVTAPTVTLTDIGLSNGTTYYYVVFAVNGSGTSPTSAQATATPIAVPAAPTGFTATAGSAQVILNWTAASGATSYKVQRSTTSGSGYADFAGNTVIAPTVTLTNTGLTNGTTYYYVVFAINGSGTSSASTETTATPIAVPVAPTGVTATAGNTQVVLNWTAVSGAASYKVQRSTTNGSGYADFAGNTVTAPTVTLTNTGLTNGTTYYYVVFAVNGSGTSASSAQVSATPVAIPVAPTGLTAAPGSAQVILNWTAVSGATSYKIQRSTTSGSGYADFAGNTVTAPTVTLTNTGLTNDTTYYYVVYAVNGSGTSPASTQASATPVAVPSAPTGVTATAGNTQVTLSWNSFAGATSYKVQRSTINGSGYADFVGNTVTAPTVTLTNTSLTNGTTYYYVVFAINGSGTSPASSQVSATPIAIPVAPTGVTAVAGSAQVALNWTAVSGAASYKIQRSTTSGSGYADFAGNTATAPTVTLTDTSLTNGTTYYYIVFAVNGAGTSPASAQATATPIAIPVAPTGVTATAGSAQVVVNWTAVSGATSYKVQRSTTSGSGYADFAGNTVTAPTVTLTDTGLTNGTPYYYVIFAINGSGTSASSSQVSATPIAIPVAPTGVTATAGATQVVLNWTAVSGAASYKIQRSTTSGSGYADFAGNTVTTPTVTFTNTGLTNGTTYYYIVFAVNGSGTSPASTQVSATPQPVPTAPTGFTATPGSAQAVLNWTAVSGATSYKIQRSTTSGSGYADFAGNTVTAPTVTLTDTGLTNGTPYYYVIFAINGSGTSASSSQVSATPIAIPTAPTGVTATAGSAQVVLNWTAVSGAASYKIQRSTTNGSGYADFAGNTVTAPTVTFTDTGLTNGTAYYYVIFAVNGSGTSPASTQATATPIAVPVAPTGLTATAGAAQVVLNWTAVSGAASYKIQRSTTNGSGYADFAGNTVTAPTVTFTNTGLTNGTAYYYIVFAVNGSGTSPASAQATATPIAIPVAPTGVTATPGSAQVVLNWTAVSGAASYKIQRSTTSGSGYADFAGNTITAPTVTLTNTGLTNGTTYYYVIFAVNGSGTSPASAQATATPVAIPVAPTGVTATAGSTQVVLNWTAVSGAASYKIQRSTTNGSGYADFAGNTVTAPTVTFTNTGLTNGTTYYYVIFAVNGSGTSPASAQATATPIAVPAMPTGFVATPGAAQVILNWTAVSGATSYKIQRSTTSGSGYADFAGNTVTAPTVTFTDTGLTNGTAYYYIIFAVNGSGTSPASTQASATPVAIPVAPTGVTAVAGTAQVTLSWSAVSGATSYKIQRSTTSGSGYADFAGNTVTVPTVTMTDNGLVNGTPYYYVILAINGSGTSPASTQVTATPLATPAGVTAVAGTGQAILSWTAVTGATSYKVQRSTTSGSGYADFAGNTVTSPTVTLTNTGLTNGTTYYYVIFAVNAGGTSTASAQVTATPMAAPTGVTATATSAQAVLNWTAVTGATSYKIQRSTTNGSGYADFAGNTVTAPTVTFTNTGLTNGTTYYYVVYGVNATGSSAASSQVSASPAAVPAAPTGVTATASTGQVVLSWTAVSGAANYKVQRSTTNGSGYVDFAGNTVTSPTVTLTNTGLTNGTTYYYVLLAINGSGTSPASGQVVATPIAAPTGVTATPGSTQVLLGWTAVTGATGYKIQRSTTNGSGYADFSGNTVTAPTVTFTNTGLTNGTTYYYVVKATNVGGTSSNSSQVSATPIAIPVAPTGVTATAGNTQVILNWTAVSGAVSYKVQRSTTIGTGYVDFVGNTVTDPTVTLTNTGLTNGTKYYYVLFAINGSGTSPASLEVNATPSNPDTDGDGLDDAWEMVNFGDLSQTATGDFDGDGLSNLGEFQAITNPKLKDTDGDGIEDGYEVANGLNPNLNDAGADLDHDTVINSEDARPSDPVIGRMKMLITTPANGSTVQ